MTESLIIIIFMQLVSVAFSFTTLNHFLLPLNVATLVSSLLLGHLRRC